MLQMPQILWILWGKMIVKHQQVKIVKLLKVPAYLNRNIDKTFVFNELILFS
jgi:hypothetical protein